jgi:hypothetical protein
MICTGLSALASVAWPAASAQVAAIGIYVILQAERDTSMVLSYTANEESIREVIAITWTATPFGRRRGGAARAVRAGALGSTIPTARVGTAGGAATSRIPQAMRVISGWRTDGSGAPSIYAIGTTSRRAR